ncbi:anti-sigma factor [Nonomuraea sp. NPDC049421]|uniref:anti-sigma factor n=1 Tax=Nonomuraea sp. NPDC049421 TaxID=3155275 RepID=UPI00342C8636
MNDELHTLSGAYAVHALPYAEWVLFEEHLHVCAGCAAEVRRLRETAARLAETVAEPPPARLRHRLLAAAHRTRSPWIPDDAPTVSHRLPVPPVPPVPPGGGDGGRVVPLRRRRRRRVEVVAGASVAVSAAAAVALGVLAFDARRDLADLAARNGELAAVLAAADAETMRRPVSTGGTGTVVVSRERGRMVFTSSGLAELPRAKAYELWLMGPGGARPAGLLEPGPGGASAPVVLTPLRRDDRVALTVEPAEGSRQPTTDPVMLADLPEA